ncbi:MAG TPA: hypothetical protein VFQ43_08880, partial [Nitrososphaera sp.]|nr:hypothetical protein [Nitrososphaera sp.]
LGGGVGSRRAARQRAATASSFSTTTVGCTKPIKFDLRPAYPILSAQNGHRRARSLFPVAA